MFYVEHLSGDTHGAVNGFLQCDGSQQSLRQLNQRLLLAQLLARVLEQLKIANRHGGLIGEESDVVKVVGGEAIASVVVDEHDADVPARRLQRARQAGDDFLFPSETSF